MLAKLTLILAINKPRDSSYFGGDTLLVFAACQPV